MRNTSPKGQDCNFRNTPPHFLSKWKLFMCLCLAMIMSSWSYGQQRFWTDPPLVRDMTTGTTTSLPTSTALNGYQGQTATRSHNGLFRRDGSTVFFVVDDIIYDRHGNFVYKFMNNPVDNRPPIPSVAGGYFSETHIIPVEEDPNDVNSPCLLYLVVNGREVREVALDPTTLEIDLSTYSNNYFLTEEGPSNNPVKACGFYGSAVSAPVTLTNSFGDVSTGRMLYFSTCTGVNIFWISHQRLALSLNNWTQSSNYAYLNSYNFEFGLIGSNTMELDFFSNYLRETEVSDNGEFYFAPTVSDYENYNLGNLQTIQYSQASVHAFNFNTNLQTFADDEIRFTFSGAPLNGEVKGLEIIEDNVNQTIQITFSLSNVPGSNSSGIYISSPVPVQTLRGLIQSGGILPVTKIANTERSKYSMIEFYNNQMFYNLAQGSYSLYNNIVNIPNTNAFHHSPNLVGSQIRRISANGSVPVNPTITTLSLTSNFVVNAFVSIHQTIEYVRCSAHPLLTLPKQIKGENITNTIDPEIPVCEAPNSVLNIVATTHELSNNATILNNPNSARVNVSLAGNFTISRDMTIRNVNFFMGGASTITILSGANVTFENCRFQACDILWRGMSANPGSSVSFTRVKFQHSFVGLTADAANVFIDDSDFEQNYFHLTLRNINRNRTQNISINRSDFTCNSDITQTFYQFTGETSFCIQPPPFDDMTPTGTQRTAIAIRVEHSDIELGDASFETGTNNLLRNRINNAHVGINSWNSNTTVRGFDLRHIYEIGFNGIRPEKDHLTLRSIRNKYSQMGLCLSGDVCFTNRPITGSEGSAIEALGNYSLFVHEDNIDRTNWWGIRYRGVNDLNTRKNLSVTNTDFKNTNFGAVFSFEAPATDILLDNNRFQYVPTLTGNFYQTPWMSGIWIEDIISPARDNPQQTLVTQNTFTNVNSGVTIGFRTNPEVSNCTFKLNGEDLAPDRRRAINLLFLASRDIAGIRYSGRINNNTFRYFNNIIPATFWKDVAIEFSDCPDIEIRENNIHNIGRGLWSFEDNLSSSIQCNRFYDVDGALAVIGNNGLGGIGQQGSETLPADNQWNKNTGYTPAFDTYTEGGVDGDANNFFIRRITTGTNARYRPTVNMGNLPIIPDLSNPNTIGNCTFSSGRKARIDAIVGQTIPSTDADLAYYNSRYSLLTEFKESPPAVTDTNQLNFVQQFDASVLGRLTDAEIALAMQDSVSANQALSLANCPCPRSLNSKTVLDIYNRTLAAGFLELNTADSASLWNIATLDRKIGGRAVLQARNMIQALADTMYVWETDNQTISNSVNKMAQIEEKTEETNAKEFLISENQNLKLRALNPEQTYQMIVYSLDGKIILDQKLENQTEANFSLSSGFYIARLFTANNNILTQKILIP